MIAPQIMATVKPCTVAAAVPAPAAAAVAMVLSSAAPIDEPSWLAALVPAPAAPLSDGSTPRSAVLRATGPAIPVPSPSTRVARRISGR
jgi:hypothetical protein